MAIEYKVTTPDFNKMGKEIALQVEREFTKAISDELTIMKLRIKSGVDVAGNAYPAPLDHYSPGYEKYRKKRGRNTNVVDLLFTGKMQTSIIYNITKSLNEFKASVFFTSSAEADKARWIIDQGRNFFGFSKEQVSRIVKRIKGAIK